MNYLKKIIENGLGGKLSREDNVTEKLAKTWGEVGLGAQFATSSNTHIYADARYEQSLSGTKHQGYKGSIGIKYSW